MSVTKADLDKITKETEKLLDLMGVKLRCATSADLNGVLVNLSGKDSAIMIGYHGENLSAFAYVLGLILHKKIDKEIVFKVDVNGYLKEKDKKISEMVFSAIEKVRNSSFPAEIEGFNAYERRLAHHLVDREGLSSESKGPSDKRILVIKPRVFKDKE
jgi:spoIIIJ-associated protein